MPASPVTRMRVRGQQNAKRLTEEEKLRRREEREKKQTAVPTWLIWFMVFVLVGSSVVQIYFSVVASPKMKD